MPSKEQNVPYRIGCPILIAAVVFFTVWGMYCSPFSGTSNEPAEPDKIGAYLMSQEFVKKQLKAPATAMFPRYEESFVEDLGSIENRFRVTAYVDSQNSFGALLRSNYTCIVESYDAKTWHCESMEIE